MMSVVNFHKFINSDILTSKLSKEICKILSQKILKKGKASLVVSGGNTPKKLFKELSLCDIAWDRVTISLCDERWVDNKDDNSNEKLVKIYLMKNFASKAKFIGMYRENKTLESTQKFYEKIIKNELQPFDIIILGMGDDGHTASLFPNKENFKEAFSLENSNLTLVVKRDDVNFHRLSLTRVAILSSIHIFLHFEGRDKLQVYKSAIKTDNFNIYPVSSILNQKLKNIEVYFA